MRHGGYLRKMDGARDDLPAGRAAIISPLIFRLLDGPLEVWCGPRRLPVGGRRNRVVLAVLLLDADRVVPATRLADAVWGERPPTTARQQITICVSKLRRTLREAGHDATVIESRDDGYRLCSSGVEIDALGFVDACRRARRDVAEGRANQALDAYGEAFTRWRGPGIEYCGSSLLDIEGARLDRLRLAATAELAALELEHERAAPAASRLAALVAEQPLAERPRALLIRALAATGRRADALTSYQEGRRLLVAELGIEPGPELREAHAAVLEEPRAAPHSTRAGTVVVPPVPAQLPAPVEDFTGRTALVARLRELVTSGQGAAPVVAAVVGAGGAGKTALAVRVAHLARERFADGQLHVDLRGSQPRPMTCAEALGSLLQGLGVGPAALPPDEAARAALLRTLLSGRRVLLFLDDAADSAHLRPLLPGTPSAAVLVTSRASLAELPGAHRVELGTLPADEAAALFARVVGPRRAAAEPAATRTVLAACAGLPLALRIAAARLAVRPAWPVAYLAGRLGDARGRLAELRVGELAVRASFQVSYDALPGRGARGEGPARTFRMLGLVAGADISVPAVAALLDEPEADVEADLEALVDVHLLGTPAPGRYRCHDLLRDFAVELVHEVEPAAARDAAVERLLEWYLDAVLAARRRLAPGAADEAAPPAPNGHRTYFADRDAALSWCEAERRNVVAAVGRAGREGHHRHAVRLALALRIYLYQRSYQDDMEQVFGQALDSARSLGDHGAEANALRGLADVATSGGQHDRAIDLLRQALTLSRRVDERLAECAILCALGTAYQASLRLPEALEAQARALAISRELGHREAESSLLNNLGITLYDMGRTDEAGGRYEEALELSRALGHRVLEGAVLGNLAALRRDTGDGDEAIRLGGEAVAVLRQAGFRHGEGQALAAFATTLLSAGRQDEAAARLRAARDLFVEIGSPRAAEIEHRLAALSPPAGNAQGGA